MSTCHYCGPTDRDLRPYGPGGSDVAAMSGGPVLIGTEEGPIPFDPTDPAAGVSS